MIATLFLSLIYLVFIFSPLIEGGITHLPVFIFQIFISAAFCGWLLKSAGERKLTLKASSVNPAVAAFFLLAVISVFLAPYKSMALVWVRMIFFYILFFYLARAAITSEKRINYSILVIMAMAVTESVWALVQWAGRQERVSGSFFNPNMLAGYLAPGLLIGLSLLLFNRDRLKAPVKAGIIAACLVFGTVIILTGSRGGVLALSAGLLVVLYNKWRLRALSVVAALVAILLVLSNPVRDRVFGKDVYAYSRTNIWKSTTRMITDHPFGVGLGNFKYYWARYNFPVNGAVIKYGKKADTAHSEYLHIGAEMGLMGLAAFILGIVLFFKAGKLAIKKARNNSLAIGLAGGITAIFVHAAVDSNFHEPGIVFLFILLSALLLEAGGDERPPQVFALPEGGARRVKLFSLIFFILLLVWVTTPFLAHMFSEKAKRQAASGNPVQALKDADTALFLEPGNAAFHSQRAALLFKSGANGGDNISSEVLGELAEAERLNPEDFNYPHLKANIEYNLSLRAHQEKRLDYLSAAFKDIRRARELNPFNHNILMREAEIRLQSGDIAGTETVLEKMKYLEPNFLRGRVLLARLYLKQGKNQLSKDEYFNIILMENSFKKESLSPQERVFIGFNQNDLSELKASLGILN